MPLADRNLQVFLCHSSDDKPIVRQLYQKLLTEEWIDPWLDEEKLLPGQDWDFEIEKAVRQTDAVIVCLSTNAVTQDGYMQYEMRLVLRVAGYKPEGVIFHIPIRLNECVVPMRLEIQHYVDYFPLERQEWAYQRLLRALRTCFEQKISRTENAEKKIRREAEERAREELEEITRKGREEQKLSISEVAPLETSEELPVLNEEIPGMVNILEEALQEKEIREKVQSRRQE